jgi:hypothetical protein
MGEGVYRDGLVGVRMRAEDLVREVVLREARLTPTFWERAPTDMSERLRRLKSEVPAPGPSLEALTRLAEALDAYRHALDDAIARVPALQATLFAPPDTTPSPGLDLPAWAVFFDGVGATAMTGTYAQSVEEHGAALRKALGAPQYDQVAFDAQGLSLLARFRCKGVPFAIGTAPAFSRNEYLGGAQVAIATSVSHATPRLVLRAETWGDDVLKAVGVRQDMEFGDMTFDGLFLVQGDREASGMLSPESRAALLRIAKYDVPSLIVEHAEARLHWRWEPDGAMIDAAVQVLAGIRNGPARLEMLR